MQYRPFGQTGHQVSALGFGCMRLPTLGSREQVDEPEAIRMLRYAIDHGVTYFDSGYNYHGGNSERVLGKALQDGYRERVYVATKLPFNAIETAADFDRVFNDQLARLQTDHIDFYLLHGLRQVRWEGFEKLGILEWAEKAKASGRIGHFGFSFHDTLDAFKAIVDAYDGWEFCQIQYNFMNEDYQAGTEGLQYAAAHGMGVVVMEPLLGGKLANPPEQIQAIWDASNDSRSAVEWAFQWLWHKPAVSLVLSGMSTMQQVQENIESASRSYIGQMSDEELERVARVRDAYSELCPAPCTGCRYCMPCPNGVDIPGNFALFNSAVMYGAFDDARRRYGRMEEATRASACIQCRQCEEECPQNIVISEWMPYIHQVLGEGQPYDPEVCGRFS
ncbi:MAG: aldo/keto reductase [Anaerolineae bacterium]|nr:aldo/keto reductase [Anaerolineae bacterium]